jgi:hypothetical protein
MCYRLFVDHLITEVLLIRISQKQTEYFNEIMTFIVFSAGLKIHSFQTPVGFNKIFATIIAF